jgi:hypothetical protein
MNTDDKLELGQGKNNIKTVAYVYKDRLIVNA